MTRVTVFPIEPVEGGKGGKGGVPRDTALTGHNLQITSVVFVAAVFPSLPEGAFAAVCSKSGDPAVGGWSASRGDQMAINLSAANNNYIGCSSFYPGDDGSFKARKAGFAACHFLMLDDLGTKVPLERLAGFELSWLIETSPGNYQGGIILAEPLADAAVAVRLLTALIDSRFCDAGATGPLSRWARLPVAINGKPKHADADGAPFQCHLIEWRPEKRYTPQEIVDRLQLELAPAGRPKKSSSTSATTAAASNSMSNNADDVLTPKVAENPFVAVLKVCGLYKTPLGSGKHDVTCPWLQEHCQFKATGLTKNHWSNANPIRKIFREAFSRAGLPYFNSHSFRNTLVQIGEEVCKTPEDFKSWSQNLGHEKVLTTFLSYGEVGYRRQGEIIKRLGTP